MTTLVSNRSASTTRWPVLLGISLGYFMVLLDTTVLSVAEPDLAASLHTSITGLQWATTAYTVAFASLLLSAGALADRHGAHRVFRIGVATFGLGSLLSSLAPDLGTLVALRALLGVAAAACVPASMAMIARLYPEPSARSRAVATWAAVSGAAVATGPIVGGALVSLYGWRAIFLVNVPIAVLVLALTTGSLVRAPRGDRRIDWTAQLAVCAALALLTDALIAAGARQWIHAVVAGVAAALAALVFVRLESRDPVLPEPTTVNRPQEPHRQPSRKWPARNGAATVLDRKLLSSGQVRAGLLVGAAVNFALTGELFVLPLLLQQRHHLSPVQTGLAFLPLTLPFVALPPLTGRLAARIGVRIPILTGLSFLTVGGVALAAAAATNTDTAWLTPGLLLTGIGIPFALPSVVTAIVNAAPEGTAGSAGGLLNSTRQVGATLGVTLMGAFVNATTGNGTARPLLLAAALCALAATTFAAATKPTRHRPRPRNHSARPRDLHQSDHRA